MGERRSGRSGGLGGVSVLTMIFVVLKLTDLIDWSWVWVFSPVWVSLAAAAVMFAVILVCGRFKKGKW